MTLIHFTRFAGRLVRQPPSPFRVGLLLASVLAYGSTGFLFFELPNKPDLTLADTLWWSIVTITTVGYGDLFPVTAAGRFLVAAPMMLFGIGLLGWVISLATNALVEARNLELRGMSKVTHTRHFVLFNYPGLDKVERVIEELRQDEDGREHDIVLVDEDLTELPPELGERGISFVRGTPSRDETLRRANVDEALHAIILTKTPGDARSDAQNLLIALAIEGRQKSVRTTVECVDPSSEEILRKTGCDSIVCLARFEAHFVGNEVLQPGMQSVVDGLLSAKGAHQLCLSDAGAGLRTFADVVEVCRGQQHVPLGLLRGAESLMNPEPTLSVERGDRIISVGARRLRA